MADDSTLVALWWDVSTKENDMGVWNTIKIFNAKASILIWINDQPLYAFYQEPSFFQEKDGVVVENFLIQE